MKFAIKVDGPSGQSSPSNQNWQAQGDLTYAETLAKELARAGHDCLIHELAEWGSEDTDVDVVIHLKGQSEYHPKPWNYNIIWQCNSANACEQKELDRYDASLAGPQEDRASLIDALLRRSEKNARLWDRISTARQRVTAPDYRLNGPLVSVLIATYNRRQFLAAALQSVIKQSYRNWELLLINDGGAKVEDIVHALGDSRIRVLNLASNSGKGRALNIGFQHSSGEYIAYNDDDDIWLPDHLERLMLAVRELPGIKLAYSDAALVKLRLNAAGQYEKQAHELPYRNQVTLADIMEFNQINGISVLHSRKLFTQAGCFDERLKALIDFDMWKRLAALAYPYHVSKITAEHYLRDVGYEFQITSLAERSPLTYRKQRLRIMKKRLPLPEDSAFHAVQEELYRKNVFEYFAHACREFFQKNQRKKSDKYLLLAEKNKVFSVDGLRILALCYLDRKKHGKAVHTFESFINAPGTSLADLFFSYYCALEADSKPHARKYALRIGAEQNSLNEEARKLYNEYNEKFFARFGEAVHSR